MPTLLAGSLLINSPAWAVTTVEGIDVGSSQSGVNFDSTAPEWRA